MKKFQKLLLKRNRFSPMERGFIIYGAVLLIVAMFFPLITISPIIGGEATNYPLLNWNFLYTDIVVFGVLIIFFMWNVSYRFKNMLMMVVGFRENESLLNFILFLIATSSFLTLGDVIALIKEKSTTTVSLGSGYYLFGLLILVGLIYNLLLMLKSAKQLRKNQVVNVVSEKDHEKENDDKMKQEIKGLFE